MRVRPRLLYIGDIAVEDTHHSAVQLYRLLSGYPAERLCVVETRVRTPQPDRRLPGVRYVTQRIANPRWLGDGTRGLYSMWVTDSVALRVDAIGAAVGEFEPDAVLTIGSGLGWLVADALARQWRVPLHLIAHDEWPKLAAREQWLVAPLRRRFGDVYRRARTRFCVSPYMDDIFTCRYGVAGTVLYPIRRQGAGCVTSGEATGQQLTVGYCGGSGVHVMPGLTLLAHAAHALNARVVVYGPFERSRRERLQAIAPVFDFRGFASYEDMLAGLGATAVLFAPLAFDAASRDNMIASFPSKLAEYTATGVPILVFAPAETSAARWARDHDAAIVVDAETVDALIEGLTAIGLDDRRRADLSAHARTAGEAFAYETGRAIFDGAIG